MRWARLFGACFCGESGQQTLHAELQYIAIRVEVGGWAGCAFHDRAGIHENARMVAQEREADVELSGKRGSAALSMRHKLADEAKADRVGKRGEDFGLLFRAEEFDHHFFGMG